RNQMRTKELAEKDSLTGLINRQKFTLIATKEMERSVRYKRELCLFMLDIDHFKHINDQYGHGIGDQVLIKLAQLVSNHMRTSDTFARWGGEEFIGLLPETSLEQGITAVEKIRTLIADHDFELDKPVTVSIGITELIDYGDNIDLFMDAADQALYQAKSGGRNRVCAI
ncbi:MAG: GGDEF domain-containing protein, partial [Anaerolineaceae bacterium]|nr:GGDEF domain-containing protein [Anaerolineaceae bacterium]